jgi:tetratricopeptide (TPR) repeat protein
MLLTQLARPQEKVAGGMSSRKPDRASEPRRGARRWHGGFARAAAAAAAGLVLACSHVEPRTQTAAAANPTQIAAAGGVEVGGSLAANYLAGRFAQRALDFAAAADYLSRVLETDPTNRDLLRRVFVATIADGRMEEARRLATRLLEVDRNEPLAVVVLVAGDLKAGRYDAADRQLGAIARRGISGFVVPLIGAWSLVGQGKTDEALARLAQIATINGVSILHDLHAGLINDLAGRLPAAETQYRAALQKSENASLRIAQALGALYERTGRADQANELYSKHLRDHPESLVLDSAIKRLDKAGPAGRIVDSAVEGAAEALFNVAGALLQENSLQHALAYGRLAIDLRADFAVAQLLVGQILESLGRHREAIRVYDAVASNSPLSWSARLRRATSLDAVGEAEQAIRELRAMSAEHKDRFDALIGLGDLLRTKKRFVESVSAYDAAIERIGKLEQRHWSVLYSRGISLERSKQWARAEQDFQAALQLSPDQPYVLNYLGYTWVDLGTNLDRARGMIERAVELRPNDGYIVDSLGWALFRMGDFEGAVKHLERAVELRPRDPTINDHLGDAYWKVGRRIEAGFQWRRALASDPEPDQIEAIRDKATRGMPNGGKPGKGT